MPGEATWGLRLGKQDFRFDAAHFLVFADGSREPLHGHNYQVRVLLEGRVGPGDVVLDFLVAKPIVRAACAELDHVTLLPARSPFLRIEQAAGRVRVSGSGEVLDLPASEVRLLPLANLSVELLASHLAGRLIEGLAREAPTALLTSIEVEVEETPGQSAWYRQTLSA